MDAQPPNEPPDFTSTHTASLPDLLEQLRVSLAVTTYQAGKLILIRTRNGEINTHFRSFPSPMGLAHDPATGRLALGTLHEIWHFRDQPAAAAKLPGGPPRRRLPPTPPPLHRRHPHPRDRLGRRRTLGRQHPLLLSRHL